MGLPSLFYPLLAGLLFTLPGCASIAYLGQAAQGQAEVMAKARPISDWLADPQTPPALAGKLQLAQSLRRFAVEELKLPDNDSYTRYADLGRPYALWNVVSTPALSLTPTESCFPVAGCLAYRGYYSEADAQTDAEQRRAQGEDVYLYGVPAYSTLGWFADPLLNTTLRYASADLARLIFHELAHQVVYLRGDSSFNEAFATAVELEGYARWRASQPDATLADADRQTEARRAAFRQLMERGRDQLGQLYATPCSEADKRHAKLAIQQQLAAEYAALKAGWGGYSGYDSWFQPAPNNAHFASLATYHGLVPAFRALFRQQGGDFSGFYAAVRALAGLSPPARQARLAELAAQADPAAASPTESPRWPAASRVECRLFQQQE